MNMYEVAFIIIAFGLLMLILIQPIEKENKEEDKYEE